MLDQCCWPTLDVRYDAALRDAVESLFVRFQVRAILVTGTILRGCGDSRSDLDIHVIQAEAYRTRLQEFHLGVPCEIFVNPLHRIEGYFDEDLTDRRPMSQHMYVTGFAVFDPEGLLPALIERGRADLEKAPSASPSLPARYSAATAFEDVCDLAERDTAAASVALGGVVAQLIECYFREQPMFVPRLKDGFSVLRQREPSLAELALLASSSVDFAERLEAARKLCIAVTGHEGFFEWASELEKA